MSGRVRMQPGLREIALSHLPLTHSIRLRTLPQRHGPEIMRAMSPVLYRMRGIPCLVRVVKTTSPIVPSGQAFPCLVVHHLKIEVCFPEMVAVQGLAIDTAAESHLGHAVMIEYAAAPYLA